MTKREQRVIKAFLSCVESGEFTVEYAIVLIEDQSKYGWLSDTAKEYFYDHLPDDELEPEAVEGDETPTDDE